MADPATALTQDSGPRIVTRKALFREIFLRHRSLWILGIYNVLQLVYNLTAWLLPAHLQAEYQLINVLKYASWRNWAIGLLLTGVAVVFEGAFRVIRKREGEHLTSATALGDRLEKVTSELATEKTAPKLVGKIHQVYVLDTFDDDGICSLVTIQVSMGNVRKTPTAVHDFRLLVFVSDGIRHGSQIPASGFAYFEPPSSANEFQETVYQLGVHELPKSPVEGYREGPTEREKWLRFRVPVESFSKLGEPIQCVTLIADDIRGINHPVASTIPPWIAKGRVDFSPIDQSVLENLKVRQELEEIHHKGLGYFEQSKRGQNLVSDYEIETWAKSAFDLIQRWQGRVYAIEFTAMVDALPFDEKYASSPAHKQRCAYLHPRLEKLLEYMKRLN